MISGMESAASAMNAFGTGLQGSAYNLANVNTDNFKPVEVNYRSGPNDQGVVAQVSRPGFNVNDTVSLSGTASPSETDVAREMVGMISDQRAYEANAQVISTADAMAGTVLDLKV